MVLLLSFNKYRFIIFYEMSLDKSLREGSELLSFKSVSVSICPIPGCVIFIE